MNNLIFWKVLHTLIWVFFASLIVYIFYCGVVGHITIWTWISIGLVIGEASVLLYNRWVCPITPIARKYTDDPADNFDIYLPNWLAKHNKTIFTLLFVAGLIMVLLQKLVW